MSAQNAEPRCGRCDQPVTDQEVSSQDQVVVDGAWQVITVNVENKPCGCLWFGPPARRHEALR